MKTTNTILVQHLSYFMSTAEKGLPYRLAANADAFLVNSSVGISPVQGLGEVSNSDFTAIQLFLNLANTASVG